MRPNQVGRNFVSTPAGRKQFDDLVIRHRNNEHGYGGCQCHVEAKVGVTAERQKCFFRAIAGGRESVGTKTHPREKSDQGNVLPRLFVERIEPLA